MSPTDPLAATAIARRLGVPRRLVTLLEGESPVSDASALVAYRLAVSAVVAGASRHMAVGFAISHALSAALRAAPDRLEQVAPQPKRGRLEQIRNTGNPAALPQ